VTRQDFSQCSQATELVDTNPVSFEEFDEGGSARGGSLAGQWSGILNCETGRSMVIQFQLFAVSSGDGFLGNVKRRQAYARLNECKRFIVSYSKSLL